MIEECWKDIEGFEGMYKISSYGDIYSYKTNKILKPIKSHGYLKVFLYKNNSRKSYLIHRLVAESFIPNPNNFPVINHKNENKSDNHVCNLEWCSFKYNANYGTRNERMSSSLKGDKNPMYGKKGKYSPNSKKIVCLTTGRVFNNIREAEEFYCLNNIGPNINRCCHNKRKSAGKHPVTGDKLVWLFLDDYLKEENR